MTEYYLGIKVGNNVFIAVIDTGRSMWPEIKHIKPPSDTVMSYGPPVTPEAIHIQVLLVYNYSKPQGEDNGPKQLRDDMVVFNSIGVKY